MREFIMGAKLQLKDDFSSIIREAKSNTEKFKRAVDEADDATKTWTDANGRLRDSLGRYTRAGNQAEGGMRDQAAAATSLKDRIFSLQGAFTALAGSMAVKAGYDWLIGANASMEQYQNTLTVVMGSQEAAVKQLEWATNFAAKTPFEIPGIVEATTKLESYGMESEKVLGITGDMASVMGKDLMQAVEAVADAQTGELERLKEFGIKKSDIAEMAKSMGADVINNKGQITDTKAFNAALFKVMEERFKGGMEMQSKTFNGMISNVKDFIGTIGRELGKPLFTAAKERLQTFLEFLNRLKESGAIDRFVSRAQRLGDIVGGVFSFIGNFIGDTVGMIRDKFTAFYSDNRPKIVALGGAFVAAFQKLRDFATPILTWLKDTALPGLVTILTTVAGWVLNVANFVRTNWAFFEPFVIGLAAAWGTYLAVTKAVQLATKVWTAYQWALNLALNANPLGIMITAVGLLIGAGILLYKNWDKVKAGFFKVWGAISEFMGGLGAKAKDWGANIIKTMLDGILGMKDKLVNGVKGVFKKVRDLLPFSDAKKGPFSQLTYSGGAIMSTLATGAEKNAGTLHKSMASSFADAPGLTAGISGPNSINAAGNRPAAAAGSSKSISVGNIVLQDVGNKDAKQLVDEIMDQLYEKMEQADEILGTDKGALL